ncbi:MAG: hypothetical protein NT009_08115 [Proteobacteria bacterium]|nr:hypothetical protein [Pseudomonadota bacterium]
MKRIRWGIPLIVALWVGACGLPESPTGGAGGVTFDLIWQEEGQNSLILDSQLFAFSPNSFHPQSLPAAVVGLRATITGSDMDQVTQTFSGLYPEGGTIVIRGVPAGDNRTLVLDGLNAGGAIVYQGTINGFTVVAEQANDIGQIVMRPYGEGIVAAPSNLQVQAVSSSQLALSWVDNANNETGFYLERKTSVGSAYSQVGSVGRDVTAYQDESLSCGMLYFYRVFAYGAVENSGYSNEVSIFLPCVDTVITLAPPSATQSPAPLFGFSCTFASCSFECDLDGGGYAICDSPHGYTGIADGQHVFSVRAVDISGRVDSSPATYSWKVDRVPPETSITQSPSSPSNSTVAFGFDCDEGNCSYECNIDSGNFSACTLPAVYRFENGVHAFSVRATDQAGNVDPTPADYSWLVIGRPNGPPGEEVPPEPIGFWQKTRSKTVPSGRYYHTAVWTGTEMIVWGGYDGSYMLDTGGRYDSSTDAWTPTGIDLNTPWGREYHTAVWDSTDGVMIVWGGYNGSSYFDDGGRYNPATDSWIPTKNASTIPYGRQDTSAVWTGSEMIIWGGYNGSYLNDGGRYDPATDTWTATVIDGNTPSGRQYQTAVWTGSEMIVWGGYNGSYLNDGGRYDPAADTWTATAIDGNTPSPRDYHTAVWDRNDGVMIVWGGTYYDGMYYYYYNGGGRYDPSGDSWATVSTDGPLGRSNHTAIWTGTEMIVWGGYSTDMMGLNPNYYNDGGRYTPFTDAWTATLADGSQPSIRSYQTAVWDSTNGWMIVWGGWDGSTYLNDGGRYDPSGDLWTPTAIDVNTPSPREYHTAVWTGADMIVWGGNDGSYTNTGGRYNPSSDTWIAATAIDGYTPSGREYHNAVWTGTEMLVWGGYDGTYANTGSGYDPSQDSWRTIAFVPLAREYHSAVWTGTEMIVWGGIDQSYSYLDTGGRYNPANDSWTPTGTGANVPSSRAYHTAVWTGTEMIVWGGYNFNGESTYYFNDGGRYDWR